MTQFKGTALAGYLMLLVFSSFIRAERNAAPSTPSAIHFRSPRGFSIVVPVYVNGKGPFEFLLDTGSTITVIDPETAAIPQPRRDRKRHDDHSYQQDNDSAGR